MNRLSLRFVLLLGICTTISSAEAFTPDAARGVVAERAKRAAPMNGKNLNGQVSQGIIRQGVVRQGPVRQGIIRQGTSVNNEIGALRIEMLKVENGKLVRR